MQYVRILRGTERIRFVLSFLTGVDIAPLPPTHKQLKSVILYAVTRYSLLVGGSLFVCILFAVCCPLPWFWPRYSSTNIDAFTRQLHCTNFVEVVKTNCRTLCLATVCRDSVVRIRIPVRSDCCLAVAVVVVVFDRFARAC